ncbi:PaaI family thioesterase [Roseomonas sp. NAR14]|uniref:PaaI family thioesterase n=1 Tax=Roseomonas acroporae TaxID=2937791 RepID=A0A9X1Y6I4_9PROT|nr:PaaI family thioesterase [Roseomonas acroporae]MCK8784473.1 PaaI family thioesterase [Roseomonas acroporae]
MSGTMRDAGAAAPGEPAPRTGQAPSPEASQAPSPEASHAPSPEASQAPSPEASHAPSPEASQAPSPEASQTLLPEAIQNIVRAGVPLAGAWGVEVLAADAGTALLRLPHHADLLRPGGSISGPALMALADVAMWAALLSMTGGRDESLTSNLNITFLRRPAPRAVLAEARVLKRGARLAYGEVALRSEGSADVVAHVTTTWAVVQPPS